VYRWDCCDGQLLVSFVLCPRGSSLSETVRFRIKKWPSQLRGDVVLLRPSRYLSCDRLLPCPRCLLYILRQVIYLFVCLFRAVTDPRDGRRVALKKLPNVFQSLVSSKRVYRELKMLCFFKHENVSTCRVSAGRVLVRNPQCRARPC
jgi:hypothetical protein